MLRTHQGTRTDRLAIVCAHRGVPGYWYLAALLVLATLPPPHTPP
ncbi:MAG TPA: hypothetical protein VEH31_28750 [Streptosporangiaceae bacterium]|nr:hypothetical protein [Streptosporangiaceae bacterium]